MEQNELLENNENDNVLEFDYTGTDQAGNLADMAENLSQEEAAAAIEAIEKVRRERADDAVRDFMILPQLLPAGAVLISRPPRNGCGWPWLRRIISASTGGPAVMRWNFL